MGLSRFPPWKPLWGGNTTHPSRINISPRPEGTRTFPKTSLIKGKCQTKAYESLCCVVWQSTAQKCHQLSISRYAGKERKFSQRATLLLWLSYFLNDSSFWLISLRAWELSCPSTQKNGGARTPLQLHKVGEKRTGLKLPLGEELGTRK